MLTHRIFLVHFLLMTFWKGLSLVMLTNAGLQMLYGQLSRITHCRTTFPVYIYDGAKILGYPVAHANMYDFVGNVYEPSNNFTSYRLEDEAPIECRRHPDWIYG